MQAEKSYSCRRPFVINYWHIYDLQKPLIHFKKIHRDSKHVSVINFFTCLYEYFENIHLGQYGMWFLVNCLEQCITLGKEEEKRKKQPAGKDMMIDASFFLWFSSGLFVSPYMWRICMCHICICHIHIYMTYVSDWSNQCQLQI